MYLVSWKGKFFFVRTKQHTNTPKTYILWRQKKNINDDDFLLIIYLNVIILCYKSVSKNYRSDPVCIYLNLTNALTKTKLEKWRNEYKYIWKMNKKTKYKIQIEWRKCNKTEKVTTTTTTPNINKRYMYNITL